MASEMRRAAQALVEAHPLAIKSEYPTDEAAARLAKRLAEGGLGEDYAGEATPQHVVIRHKDGDTFLEASWKPGDKGPLLEGEFPVPGGTQRLLKAFAMGIALLLIATAWAFLAGEQASVRVTLGLFTVLVLLGFPYVIVGLSSQRSGREAALARALQRALQRDIR